jgi:hypothetical protein
MWAEVPADRLAGQDRGLDGLEKVTVQKGAYLMHAWS